MSRPRVFIAVEQSTLLASRLYAELEPWRLEELLASLCLLVKEACFNRRDMKAQFKGNEPAQNVAGFDHVLQGHFSALHDGADELLIRHRIAPARTHKILRADIVRPVSGSADAIADAQVETYRRVTPSRRHVTKLQQVFFPAALNPSSFIPTI